MRTVVAFHGDFSSGYRFHMDAGSPDWWAAWPSWKRWTRKELRTYLECVPLGSVFVGYSRGGSMLADAMNRSDIAERVGGLVLYESPVLGADPPKDLNVPVLMVWNDNNGKPRNARRQLEKDYAIHTWLDTDCTITHTTGKGRHTKWVPYWPFRGHGWDTSLNLGIEEWVREL